MTHPVYPEILFFFSLNKAVESTASMYVLLFRANIKPQELPTRLLRACVIAGKAHRASCLFGNYNSEEIEHSLAFIHSPQC